MAEASEKRAPRDRLGTGGTIAGRAATAGDNIGYTRRRRWAWRNCWVASSAAQACLLLAEQVAQVDSKDMSFAIWRKLAARCAPLAGAARCGGHRHHAWHRHAGGDGVFPSVGAGAVEARGADLCDATGHCAGARRSAERAGCDRRGRDARCAAAWSSVCAGMVHSALDVPKGPHLPAGCIRVRVTRDRSATSRRGPAAAQGLAGARWPVPHGASSNVWPAPIAGLAWKFW